MSRSLRRANNNSLAVYAPAFPASVTADVIAWMDGTQQAYSDYAGTVPVGSGLVRRIAEATAPGSNWQPPIDSQRPRRDARALRFDYFGTTSPGQTMQRTATPAVNLTNCTFVVTFMPRDAQNSPQVGLLRSTGPLFGLLAGSGLVAMGHSGGAQWLSTLQFSKANKTTIVARWAPTGLKASMLTAGVTTSDSLVSAITGTTSSSQLVVADGFSGTAGFYGSVAQAVAINRAVTDAEVTQLLAWGDAQTLDVAYPTTERLFGVIGDSIARGIPGPSAYQAWCWSALQNIRSTYPNCEMVNAAVGGSGVAIGMYTPVIPYYSASRTRNVLVVASGTNDLANGNGQVFTRDGLYTVCDTARAAGWRVALATILDRTGSISISQAAFDSQRAFVNSDIVTNWASHADALIDLTGIANLSANGAANNASFFSADLIHPIGAGHALMEPVYRAAMLALAA